MDIQMRVHRVSSHHVEREVKFEGDTARAMVAELEVELLDTGDAGHGSLVLHFRSQSNIKAARDTFEQGGTVTMTFAKAAPAAIDTHADTQTDEPAA